MAFSIEKLKQTLFSGTRRWHSGKLRAGTPDKVIEIFDVSYRFSADGTRGTLRIKDSSGEREPGPFFQVPADEVSGWQMYNQKLTTESGTVVEILNIREDGSFITSDREHIMAVIKKEDESARS